MYDTILVIMSVINYLDRFAQGYGCQGYGETVAYNSCVPTGQTAESGGLVNTGFAIAVVVTLAVTIMFIGVLVRFWRKPSKKQPTE